MKIYKLIFLLSLLMVSCAASNNSGKKVTVHTIGDSTMAIKPDPDKNPERGWVQVLPQFFSDEVQIFNHAVNGRSTKSFRELGHWKPVLESLKKGDYLFIQFGHNDAKDTDPTRYTNPQTSYRHNLIRYIDEARSKGAVPILFSSIARRKFNKEGVLLDSHGNYTLVARLVAQEKNVPFFDMQYRTENLEMEYGVEGSKKLHLHFQPGENAFFPEGKTDDTHLSVLGATEISKLFVEELKKQNHPLAKFLKN
ncbi:rhamnogalacturonan acetylesterase [Chryseobacterium suipulveris]|uniref:Rhamnogalacturonan acetylesterase n=1 Tax=Chryseobacterium suipulveris TaxID=2929800 RepID=A0ABY4BVS5_9FLAO|nr:rhamnogalacturonan acetylesterase [Chryseobacterium suipulveris]UOE41971.1 rhamnogalacturonan acetylesterase [Chryseobacterium suipulveris]